MRGKPAENGRLIPLSGRSTGTATAAERGALDGDGTKRAVALQLIDLTMAAYSLGKSEKDEPFAVSNERPHIAMPLRGGRNGYRSELARRYYELNDSVPGSQALTDACTVLEGKAAQGEVRRLYLRVAECDGIVYIDCGTADCRAIRIGGGGWEVVDTAPVMFRRTRLTGSMAMPTRGHDLEELWRFAPISQVDRPIVLAVLVHALIQPDTPHPILGLLAEQGRTKSSTTRTLVDLIDPSPVPLRQAPRDQESWSTAASASWVVALDNLSNIPVWLSDSLCRASTGDGSIKRALYSDDDVAVTQFRRCVFANGIDVGAVRGDLAERMALADLDRLGPGARRTEKELASEWEQARAGVLGALLDLAAGVQSRLPATIVENLPRMADFAKILAAVDAELGTSGLDRYRERAGRMAADSLTDDDFIARILVQRYECSNASASRMLAELTPESKDWRKPRAWPRNARAVTTLLRRHAPALRALGWTVSDDGGRNKENSTHWTVGPPPLEQSCDAASPGSPSSSALVSAPASGESYGESDQAPFSTGGLGEPVASKPEPANSPRRHVLKCEDEVGEYGESDSRL